MDNKNKFKAKDLVTISVEIVGGGYISMIKKLPKNVKVKTLEKDGVSKKLYNFSDEKLIVDSLEERNLCKTSLYDCVRFQDEKKFHKAYKQIEQIVGFWVKDKSSADLLTSEIMLKIGEMQNE